MEEKRKKQAEDSKIEDKQNEFIRQQRGKVGVTSLNSKLRNF